MNINIQNSKEILTSDEVAQILKINKRTLARLVKSGVLKSLRPTERKTYFTREMINEYLGV